MEATNVTKVLDDNGFHENRSHFDDDIGNRKRYENSEINGSDNRTQYEKDRRPGVTETVDKEELSVINVTEDNECPLRNCESDEIERKKTNLDKSCHETSEKNIENNPVHGSPAPLAFTIDFGNDKQIDTAKYENLFQRYNARHRRNLSTSKIEIKAKKPPVVSSTNFLQKKKATSAHSEGYFSSEDDKRKTDKLTQKLKELGLRTAGRFSESTRKSEAASSSGAEKITKNFSVEFPIERTKFTICRENLPLELNYDTRPGPSNFINTMTHSATMNDLSGVRRSNFNNRGDEYNEQTNRVQYSPEKKYTKNIEYIEIEHDHVTEVESESSLLNASNNSFEKLSNVDRGTSNCDRSNEFDYFELRNSKIQSTGMSINTDVDGSERMNLDAFNVSNIDACSDGTVSEAGTYTVHKDYTDEEKARMDIDKAFSVGVFTEQERNENYVHHFKTTSSRDNNYWISEWATQVAEHNSLPPIIGGSTGRTPPLSPSKIPSSIYSRSQRSRNRCEQSDSSLDMETQSHMKERLVALPNQHAGLIDSGGESDEDTSNSYVTPPLSSQRTPTHGSVLLARRGSLTESLFKRANANESRRSMRKYVDNKLTKKRDDGATMSPSRALACLHLERSGSLGREYMSDTAESNSSRKNSLKNCTDAKRTNNLGTNRLMPSTPKLTNSPILAHKEITKVLSSPILDKTKNVQKPVRQAQNIGYYTCTENSPYMLRKSNSTSNYHEETSIYRRKELFAGDNCGYRKNPITQRNENISRSSSNASLKNLKLKNSPGKRNSNLSNKCTNDGEQMFRQSLKGKYSGAVSDSSSEGGETTSNNDPPAPVASEIKLNRGFGIRRGRFHCESDTTPNTTPEERRRRSPNDAKSFQMAASRQSAHTRGRNSANVGGTASNNKEIFKKPEIPKTRTSAISRTDTGRCSIRGPKTSHASTASKPNLKSNKDNKKSGRSNSTLTSKEVELQNWKRRKSYDPMKAAAEGKKKVDGTRKQHSVENGSSSRDNSVLRSASFHGTRGTLSLADDWSDNELEFSQRYAQAPPPCSPQLGSDSDLETSSYLQTTRSVMTAMSARINVYDPTAVDSGGESDEDTSHSFHRDTNKIAREMSDTETSDESQAVNQSPITNTKYNRAFSLRRERLDRQETAKSTSIGVVKSKNLGVIGAKGKTETVPIVSRTDSGRLSIRLPKISSNVSKPKPKDAKKQLAGNARELEMENWKRRKSYDPMKAAMEGKRKASLAKRNANDNSSSSHVSRSQSFHGPATLGVNEWSDEDISVSADEAPIY